MSATRSGSDATAGATNAADLATGLTSAVGSADSVTAQRVQNLNLVHQVASDAADPHCRQSLGAVRRGIDRGDCRGGGSNRFPGN